MTMFPHTITVYRTSENPVTFETETYITILDGVLVSASEGVSIRESGADNADKVTVYIPKAVRATDGVSLMDKSYLPPKEFERSPDKGGFWTIEEGVDFIVKGTVVVPEGTYTQLRQAYDGVYNITYVDNRDFGSLQHFEIGGR